MNNCKNCAWFCHNDGRCYGKSFDLGWTESYDELIRNPEYEHCSNWSFDGLEDWEREEYALMTMETIAL